MTPYKVIPDDITDLVELIEDCGVWRLYFRAPDVATETWQSVVDSCWNKFTTKTELTEYLKSNFKIIRL